MLQAEKSSPKIEYQREKNQNIVIVCFVEWSGVLVMLRVWGFCDKNTLMYACSDTILLGACINFILTNSNLFLIYIVELVNACFDEIPYFLFSDDTNIIFIYSNLVVELLMYACLEI